MLDKPGVPHAQDELSGGVGFCRIPPVRPTTRAGNLAGVSACMLWRVGISAAPTAPEKRGLGRARDRLQPRLRGRRRVPDVDTIGRPVDRLGEEDPPLLVERTYGGGGARHGCHAVVTDGADDDDPLRRLTAAVVELGPRRAIVRA
jgi:hypothetical protein